MSLQCFCMFATDRQRQAGEAAQLDFWHLASESSRHDGRPQQYTDSQSLCCDYSDLHKLLLEFPLSRMFLFFFFDASSNPNAKELMLHFLSTL